MPRRILVAVAWPYANGSLHLGHLAGCYLPADIFARYHRIKGNEVLMVSGSDQHGTPITIRAEQEGVNPQEVVSKYHAEFLESWRQMGIEFDLFTTTGTDNHREVVHDLFLTLREKGYIYIDTMQLPYCPSCRRFLPDRYIEGTCPHCNNPSARGDQCDSCGRTLNADELKEPRCRTCGTAPEFRESEHFFLRLSAFQEPLLEWANGKSDWRPNVINFTRSFLEEGLKDRAITRDISWGVPVPLEGYGDKRIYVWFEALIGYLSAAKEWSTSHGEPDAWKRFWNDPEAETYYFIGKDNIPFHTIVWPAILMGYGGLNLPTDVPANEFLSMGNRQFSTSRNWAVWLPAYLERYEPDPLRYCLAINMPESGDTDFSWSEFVRRNNDELVATYGNLVNRVLSFTYRAFDASVPAPSALDTLSAELLEEASAALQAVDASLGGRKFKAALSRAMALAQQANRYLNSKSPWLTLKTDREATATTLWVSMSVISCLRLLMYPFLPFSSQRLHEMLGFEGTVEGVGWNWEPTTQYLRPGQAMGQPVPLYAKLDETVVEAEMQRLAAASA